MIDKNRKRGGKQISIVLFVFILLGILVSSTYGDNNTINQSIISENITADLNETNSTKVIIPEMSEFDIDIIVDNNNFTLDDQIEFNVNLTLFGIEIYSIRANVSVVFPDNSSKLINKTDNQTYAYYFNPLSIGKHHILVQAIFQNETYYARKEVFVNELVEEKIVENNKTLSRELNESINESTIEKNETLENKTDYVEEKIIEELASENQGVNIEFNFNDEYYYEYGPILIVGNASAYDSDEKIFVPTYLEIYPEGNENKTTFCQIDVNGSREFFCELNRNMLEITKYIVKINANYSGREYEFFDEFNLKLYDSPEINLELYYDEEVRTSEKQTITVNATRGDRILEDADVGIQVIDPNNVVYSIVSEEISPGVYQGDFYGLELGNHTIKVTYAKSGEFKTISDNYFEIIPLDVIMNLDIPEVIYHNTGSLDISGILNISLDNTPIETDVSFAIYGEDTLKKTCLNYCKGQCEFTCSLSNYIEFTKYRIYATMQYDFLEYSVFKEFEVKFKEVDLGLDVKHKNNFSLGEPQSYEINAYDKSTNNTIDGATIFVEITDPDENVYRILPSPTSQGKYVFDFVGIISGYYNISLTFIKDAIYTEKQFDIFVSNEKYVEPEFEEKNISLVQLPAEVGKKVKWIREVYVDEYNKNSNLEISRYAENLKVNNLHLDDLELKINDNKTIKYSELKQWNELRKERLKYTKLNNEKDDFTFVEKVAISNKIEDSLSKIKKLEPKIKANITENPKLELSNFTGYNVISYETPAPEQKEKDVSDTKKEVTIFSEIHYENVLTRTNITESYKEQIELYWLKEIDGKTQRVLFEKVEYFDKNNNGLIDEIQWIVPHLSNQTFEVVIVIENESFRMDELEFVQQYDLARFVAKPNWPRISDKDDFACSFVLNNISYDMIQDNNIFEYYYEFIEPGEFNYKILCDSQVKEGILEVVRTEDIFRKRSEFSKTYFVNDLFYLTETSMKPLHYLEDGIWKNIDDRFIPIELTKTYNINRGKYNIEISRNSSLPNILRIEKNDIIVESKPISIVYYDSSSGTEAILINQNSENEINIYRDDNKITYNNYFDFMDVEYVYQNEKIKQNLVMRPQAIQSLPNPATFGMDETKTYVMLKTNINIPGYSLPETNSKGTTEIIELVSGEYYLDKDYYYTISNPDNRIVMNRILTSDSLSSGLLYSDIKKYENTTLVLDPSFNVLATNRDAMSIDSTIRTDYYDATSQYLFFGENNGETYQSGLQFQLDVPNNATIVAAYLTLVPGLNGSNGTFTTNISVESVDNAAIYVAGSGNIAGHASYYPEKVSWDVENWSTEYNYTTSDISVLVELVVNRSGWSRGNYIAFMIEEGNASGNYRSFYDYSSPGSMPATLTVVYLSQESRPIIYLDYPLNGTYTNNNNVLFNFTPEDDEGLDVCELHGNFSGTGFIRNQTFLDPINGSTNNFSAINLADGLYIWNVWCNDTMGNFNFNLTDFEITVDTLAPTITLQSPVNEDNISDFDLNFQFTVQDEFSPNSTCSLLLDEITNISGIISNNSETHIETISNITSGNHNWTVWCQDTAGNSAFSETWNFTVSRITNLTAWDDADYYSNFSLFENVTFYANLTDSNNNSINDSNCEIVFTRYPSFSSTYNMTYEQVSELYIFEKPFNISGQIDYNISCTHLLYNNANASNGIYIYPKTNASISKRVSYLSNDKFNITIEYQNLANYSGYIEVADFVHQDFNVSFTTIPDGSKDISGAFFGKTYYWRFFLNALQKGNLSYVVEAENDYYQYVKLYMIGFDASDSERNE
jgi:hypothetical protein